MSDRPGCSLAAALGAAVRCSGGAGDGMRVAVAGGTGFVGRFVVEAMLQAGHRVTLLGRRPPEPGLFAAPVEFQPFALGARPDLAGIDALVHAAFDHVPGRYRGGEGSDPEGFLARNRDGSVRLFEAARAAGVRNAVFLSSRAVYGAYAPGTRLGEDLEPRPDTLYGRAKRDIELALAALARPDFGAVSLRVTGVYGPAAPGRAHKWTALFERFRRGEPVEPRSGTEVHGEDVAAAVLLCLTPHGAPRSPTAGPQGSRAGGGLARHAAAAPSTAPFLLNVSDLVLDRRDLLAEVAALTGWRNPLPPRAAVPVSEMETGRLRALGWRPGGMARLRESLPRLLGRAAPGRGA